MLKSYDIIDISGHIQISLSYCVLSVYGERHCRQFNIQYTCIYICIYIHYIVERRICILLQCERPSVVDLYYYY